LDAWVVLEFCLELVMGVFCDEDGGGGGRVGTVGEGNGQGFEGWEGDVAGDDFFGGELEEDGLVEEGFCGIGEEL